MQADEDLERERKSAQNKIKNQVFQQILKEDICLKQIYVSLHGKLNECNTINSRLERAVIVDTTNYIWEWYEREHAPLLFYIVSRVLENHL